MRLSMNASCRLVVCLGVTAILLEVSTEEVHRHRQKECR